MTDYQPDAQYYEQVRPEIARLIVGRPKSILDVGCAGGFFKKNVKWDCDYHGVEPVAAAAREARANGVMVYEGFYQDVEAEIPARHFDLIVCNDVIEHVADPWELLESLKGKLAEGGTLIGSLPNVRYLLNLRDLLWRKDWRYLSAGVLDRTHLRFFTIKSARRLFEECGFEIEYLKPSGPDRTQKMKKVLAPLFWPIGTDTLYMQMAFRLRVVAK
ncbi:MAG: class I SAM-dependent methyltransferase [Kiritimatiellae bacterium]|nr:class I SAM-dependent methyltransferase [Kiritimatiellia bacterium]